MSFAIVILVYSTFYSINQGVTLVVSENSKLSILKLALLIVLVGILGIIFFTGTAADKASKITELISSNDFLRSDEGNDVAVYTPSSKSAKWDYFDGGLGIDTLWLRLTKKEAKVPKMQTDIIRFYYFLMHNSQPLNLSGNGPEFSFSAFELNLRNFENIIIELIPDKKPGDQQAQEMQFPPLLDIQIIQDSSIDSLT